MNNYLLANSPLIKDIEIFKNFEQLGLIILLPLLLVFIISGFIGLERQNVGKAAGISSHILVALAATGVAILNRLLFDWQINLVIQGYEVRPEGQRIISQVLAGVGFIGAGVILKDTKNVISGLTTAATIWSVAVLGIIIGSGYLLTGTLLGLLIIGFIYIRDLSRGVNPFVHVEETTTIDREKYDK